ncbi:M28 family peptidase [Chryseolinea lacunae]|uniref:M28 family peptidase n=1 Tax=Chryseolinea lacunae TaxID=2801331 RepID=A0ABS1KV38_9BACT|nr:M28 family peptidase [Chryseolinea lacunae]MBL0743310.1 M28 family peptidase [Chryseolinea lacunae]
MKKISGVVLFWLAFQSFTVWGQDSVAQRFGKAISTADLKENLAILASDFMEGRETGKRGQKMAAAFIQAHFENIGLAGPVNGGYLQQMELYTTKPGETYLKVGNTRFDNFKEIAHYGLGNSGGEVAMPIVFVGNATEADFNQVDVKDKAVFLFTDSGWLTGNRGVSLARAKGAKVIVVSNSKTKEDFEGLSNQFKNFSKGSLTLSKPSAEESRKSGLFIVSPLVVEKFFGTSIDKLKKAAAAAPEKNALKKIKPAEITFKVTTDVEVVKSENVLGFLEGTELKDEVIFVTAHFDHIGLTKTGNDRVNNGADDDGSGTVAVMELARVFAQAKKEGHGPKRSMLFMTVTGEEEGLFGSDYYTRHPIIPFSNTVVDLNIDMIGRRDAQHKNSPPYLYVIGADKLSTELNEVSEATNKAYNNLVFDYTYNDVNHPDRLYYRSDHWNFAKNNIPVIFYFDGIHEDYHQPSDEVDKIEFDLLTKRVQTIFFTAWELVNRENRIRPDKK